MIAMTLELSIEQKMESTHQTAARLYAGSEKKSIDVQLGRMVISVPVALMGADELELIFTGEKYAGTIDGMFFVTKETPECYRHFAAFHELAEHAAPQGFDVTGLAKHLQAIAVELGYAQATLSKEEYEKYFEWRKSVERSNFFSLKDEGIINRITGNMEKIFKSMPHFLVYEEKQIAGFIEGKSIEQVEAKKMSLGEKLTEQYAKHQETLARYEQEHSANQARIVIEEFDRTSKALAEKTKPSGNAQELKSALDQLQEAYNSGNAIVRAVLEDKIVKISKDYEKQAEAEAQATTAQLAQLNIELLWNSNNGDKELIIPIKWESRLNKKSPQEHSIAEKLYEAAVKTILDYDLEAVEEEWQGYTKIVSKNVAGKVSENISQKNNVIQLQADTINEQILNAVGQELKSYNIALSTVNSKIKMLPGQEYKDSPKKVPEKRAKTQHEQVSKKDVSGICALVTVSEAAEHLGVSHNTVIYKINNANQLHGIQQDKKAYMVPLHDLITYTYNYPKTEFEGARANKYAKKVQELTAEEFAKYKSEIADVHTINETSEILGIARSTVNLWLTKGKMHGVMHKGAWYIPKAEIELCKKLYLESAKQ